ncbi:53ae4f9d-9824-43cc-928d-456817f70a57 [Thermothielavioides terrestris]|uniref:53ae4f9d-9824-43cc-928d-456817f70a57 n=1 Tax=Thermothielavioides terrestris TaxID=2587410 RepID=A0A446B7X8_9PEZI|nr:53ae4f9d-9824-43cc-928d-456817f70a57 [Thermothielavioides terrestris]
MAAPSPQPAILVLGGTGTVGSRIVERLASSPEARQYVILAASRNGDRLNNNNNNPSRVRHVHFDWHNPGTWTNPFIYATTTNSSSRNTAANPLSSSPSAPLLAAAAAAAGAAAAAAAAEPAEEEPAPPAIRAAYLIAPPGALDADRRLADFIDLARARGVRRFVLQSASALEPGGRPWAARTQNFATQPAHVRAIRDESKIYSATGDGKIPWVSADDIAAVAVRALTNPTPPNTDYLVLGPELLSYGEIADILTEVLGRKIVHVDLAPAELEERYQGFGVPGDYSKMLTAMDTSIKFGAENRTNDVILAVTGSAPRRFRDFAESAKGVWQ